MTIQSAKTIVNDMNINTVSGIRAWASETYRSWTDEEIKTWRKPQDYFYAVSMGAGTVAVIGAQGVKMAIEDAALQESLDKKEQDVKAEKNFYANFYSSINDPDSRFEAQVLAPQGEVISPQPSLSEEALNRDFNKEVAARADDADLQAIVFALNDGKSITDVNTMILDKTDQLDFAVQKARNDYELYDNGAAMLAPIAGGMALGLCVGFVAFMGIPKMRRARTATAMRSSMDRFMAEVESN